MKRFLTLALAGVLVLGAGSVAYANICAFDPAPAATLLFPFVVYNYEQGGDGYNTLMAITNVSSEAQIAHLTLWTDYSTAILDWNVLLTGYDVVTFDIRKILVEGQLPVTDSATPGGGIFDDGPWSANNELVSGDVAYTNPDDPEGTTIFDYASTANPSGTGRCAPDFEAYPGRFATEQIDGFILDFFEDWLTASQQGNNYFEDCWFRTSTDIDDADPYQIPGTWWTDRDLSDDSWMYITVDVVNWCNKSFPDSATYFDDPDFANPTLGGEALPWNVLIGDVSWVNNADRFSEVDNAVHIESDLDIPTVVTFNSDVNAPITSYGRYAVPQGFLDYREPLPSAWAIRYFFGTTPGGINLKTYIRAYKTHHGLDSNLPDLEVAGFLPPAQLWSYNCGAYTYYAWDEDENVLSTEARDPWSRPGTAQVVIENLFPLETQEVDAEQLGYVDTQGWFLFVWPQSNLWTIPEATPYQTWMGVKYVAEGLYSGARSGAVMANYNCFDQQTLPDLGVNFDYVP
jgi:hypothetical protein